LDPAVVVVVQRVLRTTAAQEIRLMSLMQLPRGKSVTKMKNRRWLSVLSHTKSVKHQPCDRNIHAPQQLPFPPIHNKDDFTLTRSIKRGRKRSPRLHFIPFMNESSFRDFRFLITAFNAIFGLNFNLISIKFIPFDSS
jgi:hypothetical protein